MKEMTIEQKAKAYDNAYKKVAVRFGSNVADEIFPEHKKFEDDDIRKWLIGYFNQYIIDGMPQVFGNGLNVKDVIAWLEKQGEKDLVTCPICGWEIKKQGEQKSSEWHREDEQNLNACLGYIPDEFLRRWLTDIIHVKYDKPADKVEPKIKAGDWVVCNNGPHHIFQVIERSWPNAKYRDLNGTEIFLNVNTLDKQYHLWTIQDAKDGDVLYDGNAACIFRKTMWDDDAIWIDTYCGINIDNEFKVNDEDECWCLSSDCSLATKEQRDLLFQKMKEAGYEWDTKKKELKKIVAPIFHIGDRVRYKGHEEESVNEDLGDYINELSKQFPEVSFAKLSRIAVRVAKWQKEKDSIK